MPTRQRHLPIPLALAVLALATSALSAADTDPTRLVDPDGGPFITSASTWPDAMPEPADRATTIDPGVAPEGDYVAVPIYTTDGQRVLLANRDTDSVTVFDAASRTVLANLAVGDYPQGIGVTDQYAIVACASSDEVWIIDLGTLVVSVVLPTAEQPWVVRTSADGTRAYVACDIDDVCEVIDLTTLDHALSITGFPVSLLTYTWAAENGRNAVNFTGFEVTPDGQYLVVGDRDQSVLFFDTSTGAVAHTIAGVPSCTTVGLSGDGATVVAVSSHPTAIAHAIDLAGPTLTSSVVVTGYSLSTHQVAVNPDGKKAFLGINNNSSAFVNFTTGAATVLTSTYTPFSIGVSPDHSLALGIQYRFSVLDFEREQLRGQWQGISTRVSAVSPVGTTAVAVDPVTREALSFYDYSDQTSPQWLGDCFSGLVPEGDGPRRTAVTADGSMAVVTNVVSGNTSLIDLTTSTVSAILPTGTRPKEVAITPDGHWAVVTGMDSHSVFVIDLWTERIEAEVPTNLRPGVVDITPDGTRAYVGNIQGNTVSVIALDGAASSEIAEFGCGVIGVSGAAYGISSAVRVSPDGAHCLVAASFDDQVKVIDTATNAVVASLSVGDFPLQIAFNATGEYAMVTNWFGDSVSVLHLDGAASTVVTTVPTGDGPIRLAYDPVSDMIGVALYYENMVEMRVPQTGALVGMYRYDAFGSLIEVDFDDDGQVLALTMSDTDGVSHFHRGIEAIELPASPSFFGHNGLGTVAVVMPGPDHVLVVNETTTSVTTPMFAGDGVPGRLLPPGPNPGHGVAGIAFDLVRQAEAAISVYDLAGRRVAQVKAAQFPAGRSQVQWSGRDDRGRMLAAGTYLLELRVGSWRQTQKLVRVR